MSKSVINFPRSSQIVQIKFLYSPYSKFKCFSDIIIRE